MAKKNRNRWIPIFLNQRYYLAPHILWSIQLHKLFLKEE